MPDLNFEVMGAEAVPYSAAPMLNFRLRITAAGAAEAIRNVSLQCQIRLDVTQRRYSAEEKANLVELFGEPERWGETLKGMLWTHTNVFVPPFTGDIEVGMKVPCTFDFNVAATKYFYGLEDGEVPLCLLFSGTIFYTDENQALQISQISWEKEANYRLPVAIWQRMMDLYYPNSAWLNIRRDVFDKLQKFKTQNAIPSWEQAFEKLLTLSKETTEELVAAAGMYD